MLIHGVSSMQSVVQPFRDPQDIWILGIWVKMGCEPWCLASSYQAGLAGML